MRENKESIASVRAHAMVLELAVATLLRLQPDEIKRAFMAVFPKNVAMFQEQAISTTYSDEWIAALKKSEDDLLSLVRKSVPTEPES